MRKGGYPPPYDFLKKELAQETMIKALINARKPSLLAYTIAELIWIKADNVWNEFNKPELHSFLGLDYLDNTINNEQDVLDKTFIKQQIENLKSEIEPETWFVVQKYAEGYSYAEIAGMLCQTEGKVKMDVYRLRKRFRKD